MGRFHTHHHQDGQTLIETMVAIFIMVMGITAALSLALFAYSSSSAVTKNIIATGLAREGIEAVKNMRDTNWLQGTINDPVSNPPGCHSFTNGSQNAKCYRTWENQWMDISTGGGSKIFVLSINPTDPKFWQFKGQAGNTSGLQFDPDSSGVGFKGFYSTDVNNPVANGTADYKRSITITESANSPFDQDTGPLLLVNSQVWWTDKKCALVQTFAAALPGCRLELQTYLTNWKNY